MRKNIMLIILSLLIMTVSTFAVDITKDINEYISLQDNILKHYDSIDYDTYVNISKKLESLKENIIKNTTKYEDSRKDLIDHLSSNPKDIEKLEDILVILDEYNQTYLKEKKSMNEDNKANIFSQIVDEIEKKDRDIAGSAHPSDPDTLNDTPSKNINDPEDSYAKGDQNGLTHSTTSPDNYCPPYPMYGPTPVLSGARKVGNKLILRDDTHPVQTGNLPLGPGFYFPDFMVVVDKEIDGETKRVFIDRQSVVWAFYQDINGNWHPERNHFRKMWDEGDNIFVKEKDNTVHKFVNGKIKTSTDPNGNITTYEYDSHGRLIRRIKPGGVVSRYEWDAYNGERVSAYICALGKYLRRFSYDDQGRLIKIEHLEGYTSEYTWTEDNRIATEKLRSNVVRKYTYDDQGRMTSLDNGKGTKVEREYIKSGSSTIVMERDNHGRTRRIKFAKGGVIKELYEWDGSRYSYSYNINNLVSSKTTPDNGTWKYNYDENGNMTSMINPYSGVSYYSYYEDINKVKAEKDEFGNITYYSYDANGNLTGITNPDGGHANFEYNDKGLLTKITDFEGRTYQYEYDDYLYLNKIIDPEGNKTEYVNDKLSRVVKTTLADGTVMDIKWNSQHKIEELRVNDHITSKAKYTAFGEVKEYTDANGNTTNYQYDNKEQLIKITTPEGEETNIDYNELNRPIAIRDPRGNATNLIYAPDGRLRKRITPEGNVYTYAWTGSQKIKVMQDPDKRIHVYNYDKAGNIEKYSIGTNRQFYIHRDRKGQIEYIQNGNGDRTRFEYTNMGQIAKVIDPVGREINYVYNKNGELVKTILPDGNEKLIEYNKKGLTKSITDAVGNKVSYVYNNVDELTKIQLPDGMDKALNNDDFGRVDQIEDELNIPSDYEYDFAGNLVKRIVAQTEQPQIYSYDKQNRLKTMESGNNIYRLNYDNNSNLIHIEELDGTVTDTMDMVYNKDNMVVETKYPDAKTIKYDYTNSGLIKEIKNEDSFMKYTYTETGLIESVERGNSDISKTITFDYDKAGRRTKVTYPNGIEKKITYYADSRIWLESLLKDNETIYRAEYEYGEDGFLTKKTEYVNDTVEVTTYKYDGDGRLLEANYADGETEKFSYDANGNRIRLQSKALGNVRYSYEGNRLMKITTNEDSIGIPSPSYESNDDIYFTYSPEGYLIKKDGVEDVNYTYDNFHRLVKVQKKLEDHNLQLRIENGELKPTNHKLQTTDSTLQVEYDYLPTGQRESKLTIDEDRVQTTEKYYYAGNNIFEVDINNEKTEMVISTPNIDDTLGTISEDKELYFMGDHLGSVKIITDKDGNITALRRYRAFGEEIHEPKYRFGFTNREYDRIADLYFYRSRYYDPRIGRFTQKDFYNESGLLSGDPTVIFNTLQLNDYAYVGNNPVNFVDPYGYWVFGVNGSAGFGTIYGYDAGISFTFDDNGNTGINTFIEQGQTTYHLGAEVYFTWFPNVDTISDIPKKTYIHFTGLSGPLFGYGEGLIFSEKELIGYILPVKLAPDISPIDFINHASYSSEIYEIFKETKPMIPYYSQPCL